MGLRPSLKDVETPGLADLKREVLRLRDSNAKLWEIVNAHLNIHVCSHCRDTWLHLPPSRDLKPAMSNQGLWVNHAPWCRDCLDRLYMDLAHVSQTRYDNAMDDLAYWFLVHFEARQEHDLIMQDPEMQIRLKRLSP